MADDTQPAKTMLLIPKGTNIFEPDGINQVTLMFPTQDDAIVFYEYFRQLLEK